MKTDKTEQLPSAEEDINAKDATGRTPLFRAVEENDICTVRALLTHPDIDVNKSCRFFQTPLTAAAQNGYLDCMVALLAAPGIDVNKASGYAGRVLPSARRQ